MFHIPLFKYLNHLHYVMEMTLYDQVMNLFHTLSYINFIMKFHHDLILL